MQKFDKVIVTNSGALQQKYPNHYNRVTQAIDALIKADVDRGITSRLVALDDRSTMKRFGASPVLDPDDHRANKAAIDAVWTAYRPDYLVILGAPDIVAHQSLLNPLYAPGDDDDRFAPSDLPYACDAPFSQDIADFRGPTRVVGRIPDLMGSGDVAYIERVLRIAATYRERPGARYASYFGLTAAVWRKSTALSLQKTFGSAKDLHESPPEGPGWRASQLDPLTHFINCHGGSVDTKFYVASEAGPIRLRWSRHGLTVASRTVRSWRRNVVTGPNYSIQRPFPVIWESATVTSNEVRTPSSAAPRLRTDRVREMALRISSASSSFSVSSLAHRRVARLSRHGSRSRCRPRTWTQPI